VSTDLQTALRALVQNLRRRAELRWPGAVPLWGEGYDAAMHDAASEIESLLRSVGAGEPTQGWQPIETAPKDGTEILLTNGKYKRTGYWARRVEVWSMDAVVPLGAPTHWLALPATQPPEESTARQAPELPLHVRDCGKCRIENGCWIPCKAHQPFPASEPEESTER